jgi:hypothetical protein
LLYTITFELECARDGFLEHGSSVLRASAILSSGNFAMDAGYRHSLRGMLPFQTESTLRRPVTGHYQAAEGHLPGRGDGPSAFKAADDRERRFCFSLALTLRRAYYQGVRKPYASLKP